MTKQEIYDRIHALVDEIDANNEENEMLEEEIDELYKLLDKLGE